MKTTLFHMVFLLALGLWVTGSSAESPAPVYETTLMESGQKTPEVSTNELRKILAEKSATVFDARPFMEYAMSHIPGAVNVSEKPGVPISQYVSDVAEVGRVVGNNTSAPIVLYCIATDLSAAKANDCQRNCWLQGIQTCGDISWVFPCGEHSSVSLKSSSRDCSTSP
jgi:rhodanese-related sulfurtransferase